jgi:small-conductance mechanosensitive channel
VSERLDAYFGSILEILRNDDFPLLAFTAVLVTAGVFWGRRWYLGRANGGNDARGILTDALAVVTPYLAGLAIIGSALLSADSRPRPWLEVAWTLLALLALIRLVMFLLRLSLGKGKGIRAWELRATLIVWALIATQTLGWLDPVVAQLDSIGLTKGGARITIWSVLKAIATVTVFVVVSVWVARWIDRRISAVQQLAPSTRIGIGKFAYAFLIAFGVLFGLQASGVDLTALTVFSGAIGLGLGFGLQAIAANFVSGFVLLVDRSIKPGDVISFTGTTGTSTTGFGWVEELRGRHVVIRDRDGVATLVPNQNVITNPLINWSYGNPRVRPGSPCGLPTTTTSSSHYRCCYGQPPTTRAS